jgi:hypothetical protein
MIAIVSCSKNVPAGAVCENHAIFRTQNHHGYGGLSNHYVLKLKYNQYIVLKQTS